MTSADKPSLYERLGGVYSIATVQQTLDKFAVPTEEQAELKTIVNSTRSDIVVTNGRRFAQEQPQQDKYSYLRFEERKMFVSAGLEVANESTET